MIDAGVGRVHEAERLDDAQVVGRVLAGETALFELLIRRYNGRVYRALRAILRDEAEVEDAMQQAYVRAYVHLAEFRGEASFSTWLTRIAVNEGLGRLRAPVREVPLELGADAATEGPSPEEAAAARETMTLLERAIDGLAVHHRTVYVLREVEGLSTAEVARVLGITEDAAKVRLHRARLALRDGLAEAVGEAAPAAFRFLAPRCDRVVAAVMGALAVRGPG
ncbi:MAG: RNA polymerase sigma factor [Anaeromyxobacter sp.]